MFKSPRVLLSGGLLILFGALGLFAQPKADSPPRPAAPPKLVVAEQQMTAPAVTVPAGPEPWYTVFGTSEVVGFIEPCG